MKHLEQTKRRWLHLLLKSLTIHCSVFTLVLSPIPLMAGEKKQSKEVDGWKTTSSVISQISNTYLQNKMQQADQMRQMQIMQQMKVTPIRSKYFPNCMIAPITPVPHGICENISNPSALQSTRTYQEMATRNIDIFNKLMRKDQNAKIMSYNDGKTPLMSSGIACLKQHQSLVQGQLQDKLNYLESLAAKIEKQNQLFKEQNKKLLDGMKNLTAELEGGGNSLEAKSRDFSKLIGKQCSDVLDSSLMTGRRVGLRNISAKLDQGSESLHAKATFIIQDQKTLKDQLNAQIRTLQSGIKNGRIESSLQKATSLANRTTTFAPLKSLYEQELKDHIEKYNSIKKEFSEFTDSNGNPILTIPPLDQNFNKRVAEINPRTLLENSLVEDCISFNGKLSTDQILNSLEQRSTHNKGTRLLRLKAELKKVLDSTSNIEDPKYVEKKLAAIKRIEQAIGRGEISLSLNSSYWGNAAQHRYSPYELFNNLYQQCRKKYKSGQLDNGKSNRINNALKRLTEFKKANRTFASYVGNKLSNEILNCPDRGAGTGGSCKDSKSMDPASPSFCLRTSVTCANKVNSCYKKVQNEITLRENKIKTFALQYNKNVENFIASQEKFFDNIKGQVFQESTVLKQFFQGAGMSLGTSLDHKNKLFIAMPELQDSEYGVKLRGIKSAEDKMSFLKNLPKAIAHMKKLVKDQASKINKKIEEHIAGQMDVLNKNIAAWKKVQSDCTRAEKNYVRMANEANKKKQQAYSKNQAELHKFCNQLDNLRESHIPVCDGDNSPSSLIKTMDKVSGQLDKGARKLALRYRDYCNSHNNKEKEGDEVEDPTPVEIQICFDSKGNLQTNAIKKYLEQNGLEHLTADNVDVEALSKKEQYLYKLYSKLDDSTCSKIQKEIARECQGNDTEACSGTRLSNYIQKTTSLPKTAPTFELLPKYVKAATKNSSSNKQWITLGEQDISDCTANNNIQQSVKGAFNDILAIQKGFNKGYLSQ